MGIVKGLFNAVYYPEYPHTQRLAMASVGLFIDLILIIDSIILGIPNIIKSHLLFLVQFYLLID